VAVDSHRGIDVAVTADRSDVRRSTGFADRDGSRPQQENGDGKQRHDQ
jgi:hypothetical protein